MGNDDVTNILFSGCKFEIEGVSNGKKTQMKNRSTGAGKYVTYADEQPQELANWNYLSVSASPL